MTRGSRVVFRGRTMMASNWLPAFNFSRLVHSATGVAQLTLTSTALAVLQGKPLVLPVRFMHFHINPSFHSVFTGSPIS
jgi:hypothetical protein